jgi:hypothetical protein
VDIGFEKLHMINDDNPRDDDYSCGDDDIWVLELNVYFLCARCQLAIPDENLVSTRTL